MKQSTTWRVVGLSVFAGSGWVLTQAYPSEIGFPFAGSIHFALIALSALLVSSPGRWQPLPFRSSASIAAAGACIFVLPASVLELTAGGISPYTSAALFCIIPVAVVFGSSTFETVDTSRRKLWPALVGLFGALLLFPVPIPGSTRRTLCFAAVAVCCIFVGLASVWMHSLLRSVTVARAVAIAAVPGALALGIYGAAVGWPGLTPSLIAGAAARCLVFDLPVVWSTVWLMREASPAKLSARFLIAPLVTAAEGYAIERGPLDAEKFVALGLVAAGAAMLLLMDEAEEVPSLNLQ